MTIKTLFLASLMIASALASENKPYPAALLIESNFDFSLTRKEFRVHYGGPKDQSSIPNQVSIKLYGPDGGETFKYDLKEEEERNQRNAFHFALDSVEPGKYDVEVCEGSLCSAKTPSLTNVVTTSGEHMLSCKPKDPTGEAIEVKFLEPTVKDWAKNSDYKDFSKKINNARGAGSNYITDYENYSMNENPSYQKAEKRFHTAINYDLTHYRKLFNTTLVDEYCGRKNMLSLHSHIVKKDTRKIILRFKTVNHLSEGGKQLFILSDDGGKILLESTHENVVIPAGSYEVWVSLCVTNKDTIESTYCANPITKTLEVTE